MECFKDFEAAARITAVYTDSIAQLDPKEAEKLMRLAYVTLGLAGEAGELANKVKKLLRGDATPGNYFDRAALIMELGDVLWYVAAMATELGVSLDTVAEQNIDKLKARASIGTLKGAGDER